MPLTLTPDGWVQEAQHIASPNCDDRPEHMTIDMVVIHSISLPPGQFSGDGVVRLFTNTCDPAAHPVFASLQHMRVSAHFFIRRDGALIQFVPIYRRAWHAGLSEWQGRERCNDFSVGIELEGGDAWPYEDAQYAVLNALLAVLRTALPITHLVGHNEIAPGRKTDPGPFFDWQRVGRAPAI